MSFNNRKFNPNIWETNQPVHPVPPFVNNQNPFYLQNQGHGQFPNNNFNQNFQQNFNNQNIRPLLALPLAQDPPQQSFRKFNNQNQDNYRRPGPAFTRNSKYGNNSMRWKDNRRDDFSRENIPNDSFENHNNNNRPRSDADDYAAGDSGETPKTKSLVDLLKAVQNSKNSNQDSCSSNIDAICAKNAAGASKKLLTQLKTMDKDGMKELITNPKAPYKKKVLNIQAREKLREQMRKKLKSLGNEGDFSDFQLEPDECIDYANVPEAFIAQIGRTIDMDLGGDDMDLSESLIESAEDIEVVKTNLGNDFLMGSEMLLMNGFSLLAETDNETDDNVPKFPPLPSDFSDRPPSPPPEPVPAPPKSKSPAAFTSVEKPWSPGPKRSQHIRFGEDTEWNIDKARNPDPPSKSSTVKEAEKISQLPPPPPPQANAVEDEWEIAMKRTSGAEVKKPALDKDDEWDIPGPTASAAASSQKQDQPVEGQRANETYGDYRRRLASDRENKRENKQPEPEEKPESNDNNKPQSSTRNDQPWNNRAGGSNFNDRNQESNGRSDSWMSNNRRGNNQNDSRQAPNQNRKSRFEMNRERERERSERERSNRSSNNTSSNNNNSNNSNFRQRNSSHDTTNSHDSGRNDRFDDVKDVHNYRIKAEKNSQEPDIERLNTLLNPKPLQFKGSFNKRTNVPSSFGHSSNSGNFRSRSRNRTPLNNSMDRDFDENLLPPPNDIRPCFSTLKKVMEIDADMAKIHEKIHGLDKVISNLQSERVGHQKSFAKLQHDRKILFDNLMKRAMTNADDHETPVKEKSVSNDRTTAAGTSQRSQIEKKLQNIVDQKKRKIDDQPEEPTIKKKASMEVMETTSAAEKAAQLQKKKEEEERRVKVAEKRRLKRMRRNREEAERVRLDERVQRAAAASTAITIKQEPRDKSSEKSKSKHVAKSHKAEKPRETKKILFTQDEIIQADSFKTKKPRIELTRVPLVKDVKDAFMSSGYVEVNMEDWSKWVEQAELKEPEKAKEVKVEPKEVEPKEVEPKTVEDTQPPKSKSPPLDHSVPPASTTKTKSPLPPAESLNDDPLAIPESNEDHLAMENDEDSMNPPTPGSNLTSNEDSMLVEIPAEQDYTEWTGSFGSHESPVVHLQNINNKYVVCATEDGKVFKYHLVTGKLSAVFSKHTEICNSFLYDERGSIYTVSSDGFLHKIKLQNFHLVASENFNEPLQVIVKSKAGGIYVGTKSGKIFRLKADLTEREEEPICIVDAQILNMKSAREGSRNVLLVSSRNNGIQVRDANNGLLLRTLSDVLSNVSIYEMLIDGSTIYCGSNQKEIFAVDFHTGALKKSRPCGAGAICVKLYKHHLIAACYDGNIYIFNTKNEDDAVNICGPSNMLLAMDLWGDKIIASTKDKTLKIMNIPTC